MIMWVFRDIKNALNVTKRSGRMMLHPRYHLNSEALSDKAVCTLLVRSRRTNPSDGSPVKGTGFSVRCSERDLHRCCAGTFTDRTLSAALRCGYSSSVMAFLPTYYIRICPFRQGDARFSAQCTKYRVCCGAVLIVLIPAPAALKINPPAVRCPCAGSSSSGNPALQFFCADSCEF